MTKQELIDKYIETLGGKVRNHADLHIVNGHIYLWYPEGSLYKEHMCTVEEFEQRARELGWINGYKWGVEYETNGKKPDLDDDVQVEQYSVADNRWNAGTVSLWNWGARSIIKFRIVDERYKPVSELVKQGQEMCDKIEEKLSSVDDALSWYNYDKQQAIALPPVGADVEVYLVNQARWAVKVKVVGYDADGIVWRNGIDTKSYIFSNEFRPLDWNRKAEEEKRKFVDKCYEAAGGGGHDLESYLMDLYDAGCRFTENRAAS